MYVCVNETSTIYNKKQVSRGEKGLTVPRKQSRREARNTRQEEKEGEVGMREVGENRRGGGGKRTEGGVKHHRYAETTCQKP